MSISKHIKEHAILGTPSVVTNSDGSTSLVGPDGTKYAALPVDANGNIIANVNHRLASLASLLGITGGAGEIAVPSDRMGLVKYLAGGVPNIIGNGPYRTYHAVGASSSKAVPTGTLTDLILDDYMMGQAGDFDLPNGLVKPENCSLAGVRGMRVKGVARVSIPSPASNLGTYRTASVRIYSGTSYVTIGNMQVPPAPLGQATILTIPTESFYTANQSLIHSVKVSVKHDSTETLNCILTALEVETYSYRLDLY